MSPRSRVTRETIVHLKESKQFTWRQFAKQTGIKKNCKKMVPTIERKRESQ